MMVNTETVEHYKWGQDCDGWILANADDLRVIEERMPPQSAEVRHYHAQAKPFFYV
jgi:hypothetical protein